MEKSQEKNLHLGIIMDGNRRYAKRHKKDPWWGHMKGAEVLKEIVIPTLAEQQKFKEVSLFAFAKANWKRGADEVRNLMDYFIHYLDSEKQSLLENGICFKHAGDKSELSSELVKALNEVECLTKENTHMVINLALNYSGMFDLLQATEKVRNKVGEITEEDIRSNMQIGEFDVVYRPGGEMRISGFNEVGCTNAEFIPEKKLFPELTKEDIQNIYKQYSRREIRLGK